MRQTDGKMFESITTKDDPKKSYRGGLLNCSTLNNKQTRRTNEAQPHQF